MRKPVIAGNWKMYKTVSQGLDFLEKCIPQCREITGVEIVICPTFLSLAPLLEKARGTNLKIGAQNTYWEKEGAFTGEVSPFLLGEMGVHYVILGHSERRSLFGEKDEGINRKLKAALENNLRPVLCVGETLEEREKGITAEVVRGQLSRAVAGLSAEGGSLLSVAYEPVWAIGTGKTALVEDAREVIALARECLEGFFPGKSEGVPILYGGSVKPGNLEDFLVREDIDGALVGGASLEVESFLEMVRIASEIKGKL